MRADTAIAVLLVVLLVVAAALAWWRLGVGAGPDAVTKRLIDGVVSRHPGATARSIGPAIVEAMLPSGVSVDLRADAVQDACGLHRARCASVVDRALDDADRAEAAALATTGTANRDRLRPVLIADSSGYRYGYIAEPFFGTLELRYALESGLASTFVTGAIADRLHLAGTPLRDAALAGQARDPAPTLARLAGDEAALYRVQAEGDPVAVLLDHARLAAFGTRLGTRRLVCHVPSRGVLYVAAANDATAAALDAMRNRADGLQPIGLEPFTVDLDAPPDRALATIRHVK